MAKVAIVGSRNYPDLPAVFRLVETLVANLRANDGKEPVLITGGAIGVDEEVERAAPLCGVTCQVIKPKWNLHGKAAGPIRNAEIVRQADIIYAFWDGNSRGTANTIELAKKAGKTVVIIEPPKGEGV